jgi:hypothetical protein
MKIIRRKKCHPVGNKVEAPTPFNTNDKCDKNHQHAQEATFILHFVSGISI